MLCFGRQLFLAHACPWCLSLAGLLQRVAQVHTDRERAEVQKLRRQTKKEKKGAMRELRKDGAFLAARRDEERRKTSDYLEARGKRALTLLETQEHDVKEMKKEKRKAARG